MIFRQSLHPPSGKGGCLRGCKKRQAVIEMLNTQMIFEPQKREEEEMELDDASSEAGVFTCVFLLLSRFVCGLFLFVPPSPLSFKIHITCEIPQPDLPSPSFIPILPPLRNNPHQSPPSLPPTDGQIL